MYISFTSTSCLFNCLVTDVCLHLLHFAKCGITSDNSFLLPLLIQDTESLLEKLCCSDTVGIDASIDAPSLREMIDHNLLSEDFTAIKTGDKSGVFIHDCRVFCNVSDIKTCNSVNSNNIDEYGVLSNMRQYKSVNPDKYQILNDAEILARLKQIKPVRSARDYIENYMLKILCCIDKCIVQVIIVNV